MMKCLYTTLTLMLLFFGAEGQISEETAKKYPASLDEVPVELRYPVGAELRADRDGNYVVDGKIRWLLGAQPCKIYDSIDCLPTPGYPDSLKWLYEKLLDFDTAQRIGLDSFAPFTSSRGFITHMIPGHSAGKLSKSHQETMKLHADFGLPLQVDFTATPWGKGMLNSDAPEWDAIRSKDALNEYHKKTINHWVPYNVYHPDARRIYKTYWEAGIEEYKGKSPVICYELFNEPGYDDPGEYNRKLFVEWLRKKYQTPENMDRNWNSSYKSFESAAKFKSREENGGLGVDWTKFMEEGFVDLCRFGHQVITAKVPGAWTSMQPCGHSHYRNLSRNNVNPYEVNKYLTAISLPTGGGIGCSNNIRPPKHAIETPANSLNLNEGILMRHYYRNIGEGKPILNGELYIGKKAETIRYHLWQDLLRGSNASYVFEWTKRAWDWKPRNEEGGKLMAQRASYYILNPYAEVELYGIMEAKKEIFRFKEYFMPRNRGENKREVAIMISYPTERKGLTNGNFARNDSASYAAALEYSHYPIDVILEEQLPEKRQNRYKAIVAAGVLNVYDQTPAKLLEFAENGGILILARHYMTENEYGHPADWNGILNIQTQNEETAKTAEIVSKLKQPKLLPGKVLGRNTNPVTPGSDWETIAESSGKPVIVRKQIGQGFIYLISVEMQDYYIATVLGSILTEHGIHPKIELKRPDTNDLAVNIEVFTARRNGNTLHFLLNADLYPKLVVVSAPEMAKKRIYSMLDNRELMNDENSVLVFLPGGGYTIIGSGNDDELKREFGPFTMLTKKQIQEKYQNALKQFNIELKNKESVDFVYKPDLSRVRTIDLRRFCNRGFMDSVAEDGEGGWTDQGRENSLNDVPWGVHTLLGVPCDLIRWDMNNDKTCIVLDSKSQIAKLPEIVRDIRIGGKIRTIYFFHTVAWVSGKVGVIYRVHYASGKTLDVPAEIGKHIGNWWISHSQEAQKIAAFKNRQQRGFQCMEWFNPNPEDEILSLDIVSPQTEVVPIVIGITVEEYVPKKILPFGALKIGGWGKVKTLVQDETCKGFVSQETKPYAGFSIAPADRKKVFDLTPVGWEKGELVFEINGGEDFFGNHKSGQNMRISLIRSGKDWQKNKTRQWRIYNFIEENKIDDSPDTFQTVRIPLKQMISNSNVFPFDTINFQYGGDPQVGLEVRNVRLEIQE